MRAKHATNVYAPSARAHTQAAFDFDLNGRNEAAGDRVRAQHIPFSFSSFGIQIPNARSSSNANVPHASYTSHNTSPSIINGLHMMCLTRYNFVSVTLLLLFCLQVNVVRCAYCTMFAKEHATSYALKFMRMYH